jgi:hypothetical protein
MVTRNDRFGYTAAAVGCGAVPYNISADVVQGWFTSREVDLLCDADVAEVERRYRLPFRADTIIVRKHDGSWGVTNAGLLDGSEVW